jgi:hypothetical protein
MNFICNKTEWGASRAALYSVSGASFPWLPKVRAPQIRKLPLLRTPLTEQLP